MATEHDDDRPKRSWREIDSMRDKSAQRRGESSGGRGGRPLESSQAYRSYKTQLNKLFDGGVVPDALKSKLDDKGVGDQSKKKKLLLQAILDAKGTTAVRTALEEYRAAHGEPQDEEVFVRLLDIEDEGMALCALDGIAKLQAQGALKRGGSLKARIKTAQMTLDSPRVTALARDVLASL